MGAVVLGHVVSNNHIASMDAYRWHIPGFLLISGYFGIRFSWRKIVALLSVVYGCYWLTIPYRWGTESLLSLLLPHGGWFLPFYLVLMVLAPILNVGRGGQRPILVSVAILSLLGWIPTLSSNSHVGMIRIAGLQGDGVILMLSTYFIGDALRVFKVEKRFHSLIFMLFFVVGVMSLGFWGRWLLSNSYASPAAILTAIFGLLFFCKSSPNG